MLCRQCGRLFEIERSLAGYADRRDVRCPSCSASNVELQLSMVEVKTSRKS
jgi:hypothetical protein